MNETANIILHRGKPWRGEIIPDMFLFNYYFDLDDIKFDKDAYNLIKKKHDHIIISLPYSSPNNLCWNPDGINATFGKAKIRTRVCPIKSDRHNYRNSLLKIVPEFLWETDCTFIITEYHEVTRTLLYYEILWMIHDLEEKKGVNPERFILSDCNISSEDERVKIFYTSFPHLEKRVRSRGFNHFEALTSSYYSNSKSYNLTKERKKKFIFLNRLDRKHRDSLILKIAKEGFLFPEDNFHFSFILANDSEINEENLNEEELSRVKFFLDGIPHILDTGGTNRKQQIQFALEQPLGPTTDTPRILNYAQDSYFNLITEALSVETMIFLTEKTFKCFAWKQPFILMGNPGSLRKLHEMGYKTFHPLVDEKYDEIIDVDLRIEAVYQEVKKICEMSLDETHDLYQEMIPIVEHNYENFNHQKVLCRNYDYTIKEFLNPTP